MKSFFVCAIFFSFMIRSTHMLGNGGMVLPQYQLVNRLAGQINLKYEYFLKATLGGCGRTTTGTLGAVVLNIPQVPYDPGFDQPPTGAHGITEKDCLDLPDGKLMCLFKIDQYITLNADLARKVKAAFAKCERVPVVSNPGDNPTVGDDSEKMLSWPDADSGNHVRVGSSESNESKGFVFSWSLVFAYLLGASSTVFVHYFLSKRKTGLTVTFLDDI